jgi:hypothetical protein
MLSRREQALLAAFANTLFPPRGPIPLSGAEANVVAYFDAYMQRSAPRQRFLMRLLFVFTELAPIVFGPRRRRFTRLSLAERLCHFDNCGQSTFYFRRIAFLSFRTLTTMAYLAHPEVERAMRMEPDIDPFRMGGEPKESGVRSKAATLREIAAVSDAEALSDAPGLSKAQASKAATERQAG